MLNKVSVVALLLLCLAQTLCADDKVIYLTFDDGPLGGTENIMSVLEEESVPATFFMVGFHIDRYKEKELLLKKIKDSPYVLLGNHSYSHAYGRYNKFYSNPHKVLEDFKLNNKTLNINTNDVVYARLPGRDVFRLVGICSNDPFIFNKDKEGDVSNLLFDNNFFLFGWDHEWEHLSNGKPKQSINQLIEEIDTLFQKDSIINDYGLILLMHDQMFRFNKENLRWLIQALKSKGYKMADLSEYPLNFSNIEGISYNE